MTPLVSIIVRSFNDRALIDRTLDGIRGQRLTDFELIHVDNTSTDGTYEAIQSRRPDLAYQIPAGAYRPGRVLNEAVGKARGTLVVFNNSDCVPLDERWLENLVAPLRAGTADAVYGRQVPRADAAPLVIKDYARAFGDGRTAAGWHHFFSLATSAAPRALLLEHPFNDRLRYSEDVEWSYRLKGLGRRIAYAPEAVVEHSHNYTLRQVRARFHGEGVAEGFIYGRRTGYLRGCLKPWAAEVLRDAGFLLRRGRWGWLPRAPLYRAVQKYAVYRGRRDFFAGRSGMES